jgi:hypothetical protein
VDSCNTLFRRIAGISALLAVLVGGLSGVLFVAAGRFGPDVLLDPMRLLESGASRAQLLRPLVSALSAAVGVCRAGLSLRCPGSPAPSRSRQQPQRRRQAIPPPPVWEPPTGSRGLTVRWIAPTSVLATPSICW